MPFSCEELMYHTDCRSYFEYCRLKPQGGAVGSMLGLRHTFLVWLLGLSAKSSHAYLRHQAKHVDMLQYVVVCVCHSASLLI